jgi:hypothetical protein
LLRLNSASLLEENRRQPAVVWAELWDAFAKTFHLLLSPAPPKSKKHNLGLVKTPKMHVTGRRKT